MNKSDDGIPLGTLLLERYRIEKEIETGAMSHVYISKDEWQPETRVIIKTPVGELVRDRWVVKKFKQEAESLARIEHPNIVRLIAHGNYEDSFPFLILEYVAGQTLTEVLKHLTADPGRAAKLFLQITRAIEFAHSRQIFHRDLKPDNIMIERPGTPEENVKLIDFGIARIIGSFFATGISTRYEVGTPYYLSPNRMRHNPDDRADDIYALGLIAYEMLTGFNPLNGARNYEELMLRHERISPPRRHNPDIPDTVNKEVVKALSLNPVNRHESALEFGRLFYRGFWKDSPDSEAVPPAVKDDEPADISEQVTFFDDVPEPEEFDEEEFLAAVSDGERFLLRGEYEAAAAFYRNKIASNPNSDLFYVRRATSFLMLKEYEKASADCQKALKLNEANDFALLIRGIVYRLRFWTAEAEMELLKAVQINQNNVEAALILGDIYVSLNEIEKALSYYGHICRINPRFSWVYTNRGNLHYARRNFEESVRDFTLAIKYNPDFAWNYFRRAKALTKNGSIEQALRDFDSAIERAPKNVGFYNERARLLLKISRHSEAVADFDKIKELNAGDSLPGSEDASEGIDKKSGLASLIDYLKWSLRVRLF